MFAPGLQDVDVGFMVVVEASGRSGAIHESLEWLCCSPPQAVGSPQQLRMRWNQVEFGSSFRWAVFLAKTGADQLLAGPGDGTGGAHLLGKLVGDAGPGLEGRS